MVLKRKLPSHLTQDQDMASSKPSEDDVTTDFETTPDVREEQPVDERAAQNKPPENDVFEDIPPPAIDQPAKAPQPPENKMKRRVRNKRGQNNLDVTSTLESPQASASKQQVDEKTAEPISPKDTAMMEMSPDAATRPDAEDAIDKALADLHGKIPDPAEQEIEAAYQAPAELDQPVETPRAKASGSPKIDFTPPSYEAPTALEEEKAEAKVSSHEAAPTAQTSEQPTAEEKPDLEGAAPPKMAPMPPAPDEDQAAPGVTAPASFAEQSVQAQDSTLPWVAEAEESAEEGDDWEIDTTPMTAPIAPPSQDVYQGLANEEETASASPMQPGITGGMQEKDKLPPPELPATLGAAISSNKQGGIIRIVALFGVLVAVGFGAYQLVKGGDKTQEKIARFTGALTEVSEKIPAEVGGAQNINNPDLIQPDEIVMVEDLEMTGSGSEAPEGEMLMPPMLEDETTSTAQIEFMDVSPEEAGQPVVADGDEPMPEDVGLIAGLQQAILNEREKQGQDDPGVTLVAPDKALSKAEKKQRGIDLRDQLQAELEAYRKALIEAEDVADLPDPSDFVPEATPTPPKTVTTPAGAQGLPPSTVYAENPYNLPIVPEPEVQEEPGVRTLDDFDVTLFDPPRSRVRMPKDIRPRIQATDFPAMEVLSFVPMRGIIAQNRGQEGVLLLGETLEGWELVDVQPGYAEFRNGQRKHYVTRE